VFFVGVILALFRGYWSAVLLGAAAVVLLIVGTPARAALAGAGFALFGAAVTRGIDLANERRADAVQADASRRRDLDETRRLAYALLERHQSEQSGPDAVLCGSLINALVHHGLDVDQKDAIGYVTAIDQGDAHTTEFEEDPVEWLLALIERMTAELAP